MVSRDRHCAWIVGLAVLAWSCAVAAGFSMMERHAITPGPAGRPPSTWPAGGRVVFDPDRVNLVMFVHPRCPCSRASLNQLERVLSASSAPATATLLFAEPAEAVAGWSRSHLWERATAIPGVRVVADRGGAEARRFGVMTSGHVLAYDPAGRLRYSGGITASRGHEGDSLGGESLREALSGHADRARGAVFGCPLASPGESKGLPRGGTACRP
jgi:hypothetical protein